MKWYQGFFVVLSVATAVLWLQQRIAPELVVMHVSIDVARHKPNGKAWDGEHGLPDPKIELRQGRETLAKCPARTDQLHVECDLDAEIAADRQDARLIVRDEDDFIDDEIGEVTLRPVVNGMVIRDHVESIDHVEVELVETSAWQRYGATLCAVGGGIAAMFALWSMALGRVVRRREASDELSITAGVIAIVGFAIEAHLMRPDTSVLDSIGTFGTVAVARGLGAAAITLAWCAAAARARLGGWDVVALALGIAAVVGPIPAGGCALVVLLLYAAGK